jgi:hypothetical protein
MQKIINYIKRKLAEFIYPEWHKLYDQAIEIAEKKIK